MLWPFAIAAVVFWLVAFKGRRRGNLTTMRDLIAHHGVLCRRIAAERQKLLALQGDARGVALARLDALGRAREQAERDALRLRQTLLKGGFALDGAQLMTVEDAEAELQAELARRTAG